MPRIKQLQPIYDEKDFRQEIFRRMADRYSEISVRKLAEEVGISHSSLNQKIRHSTKNLDVHEMRLIIPLLKPDPMVMLRLIGYTSEDIRKFKSA